MGNKFFWVYMAVVRLIFRFCVGNHPMGVRFAARNHPTAVRFVARNHPTAVRFVAGNLKINRARPVNGPMASIGPYK